MARRRAAARPAPPAPPPVHRWRHFLAVAALGVGLTLLLVGVIYLNRLTRAAIRDWDRFTVSFADVDCLPPPGKDREEFLAEVQFLSDLPNRLRLLDHDLPTRLAEAFSRHPWVERVVKVEVVPLRRLRVRLVYRTPVLRVLHASRACGIGPGPDDGPSWAVDGHGVLLPSATRTPADSLPLLFSMAVPTQPAGVRWDDPTVQAAARTAGVLWPQRESLDLGSFVIELHNEGLVLRGGTACILWGGVPGAEKPDEAPAAVKVQRLLEYVALHGGLDRPGPRVHDVRPQAGAVHRPLPHSGQP